MLNLLIGNFISYTLPFIHYILLIFKQIIIFCFRHIQILYSFNNEIMRRPGFNEKPEKLERQNLEPAPGPQGVKKCINGPGVVELNFGHLIFYR